MSPEIAKAMDHTLVLLTGDEDALRRSALKEIIVEASGGDDFDLENFFADASEPSQWTASAGTAPFLSPRRTVVVRNLLRYDEPAKLEVGALPPSAMLVLVADDEVGDPDKQRKLETIRKQWEAKVKASKGYVANFRVDPKGVRERLRAEAEGMGKKMNDRAAETLAEMTGGSLSRGLEELEKLALYVGSEPQILESHVREAVLPSREWNVFKLVDGIVQGNTAEALRQLRVLIGTGTKPDDAIYRSIFPNISKQLRLIWQARMCIEENARPSALPTELQELLPGKPNLASEADWSQNRAMGNARNVTFPKLAKCFAALSEAEAKLKGLGPSHSPIETLEQMVLTMIQAVKRTA